MARGSVLEILVVALRLGLTSFGGPIAHLGYFHDAYVVRRRWLDEGRFAELVALAQAAPGPTSSQVGIGVGWLRAGPLGGLAAWLGFTLPSAAIMLGLGVWAASGLPAGLDGPVAGLKLAAVAVVAVAVLTMARSLTPDLPRGLVAVGAAAAVLLVPVAFVQVVVIAAGALVGWLLLRDPGADGVPSDDDLPPTGDHRRMTLVAGSAFVVLLLGLPLAAAVTGWHALELAWAGYRAGSLVFGGGHVVLPLLETSFVGPGWLSEDAFLAGYGAAQALPGPLFTFAGYLGAAAGPAPNGLIGGLIALVAIFLPGGLLVVAALPWWRRLRSRTGARSALRGVEAAVVGILAAALWDPVIRSSIHDLLGAAVAGIGFLALASGRVPPIAIVALGLAAGILLPL